MMTNDKGPEEISNNLAEEKALAAEQAVPVGKVREVSPRRNALIVFGFVLIGFFVGQFVASIVVFILAFTAGMGLDEMQANPNAIYDYLSLSEVLTSQMLYTLVFTFVTPWFYLMVIAKKKPKDLSPNPGFNPVAAGLAFLATFAFMFVNVYLVEWNQAWTFPEFMSGFEDWARSLEEELAATTERFTNFETFGQFLLGFIAIAVLPGIGEEFLFRGVVQNSFEKWFKNQHVAIWVAAFLFSAIHMQLYGLVPRMVLGAIFGYLYVWSGNLWYPIIAHATNNGISVILVYLANIGVLDMDIEETESLPIGYSIAGLIVFAGLMVVFRNHYLRQKTLSE